MPRIVPGITTLEQHIELLHTNPERYRPPCCPTCGLRDLCPHGSYERKADRGGGGGDSLNPVAIPRFYCAGCGSTCSRLPECVAPRRWYGWERQQAVIEAGLADATVRSASEAVAVSRHTVRRWWRWFCARAESFMFHLRSRFADLGRGGDVRGCWRRCLEQMALSRAMAWLDLGLDVP